MARKKAPVGSLLKRGLRPTFIRQWREEKGLTQAALADQIEELLGQSFTRATLSRIETGKGPYSQRTLEALAEALHCSPGDLLMRNPLDKEAAWSLFDRLQPADKTRAAEFIRVLTLVDSSTKRTGTGG